MKLSASMLEHATVSSISNLNAAMDLPTHYSLVKTNGEMSFHRVVVCDTLKITRKDRRAKPNVVVIDPEYLDADERQSLYDLHNQSTLIGQAAEHSYHDLGNDMMSLLWKGTGLIQVVARA